MGYWHKTRHFVLVSLLAQSCFNYHIIIEMITETGHEISETYFMSCFSDHFMSCFSDGWTRTDQDGSGWIQMDQYRSGWLWMACSLHGPRWPAQTVMGPDT